jgi:hypothetical protein
VSWRLALSIKKLEAQLRAEVPGITLGDIGDAAHPAKGSESDHNPWMHDANGIGVVRACDIMHPPNGDKLAANLAAKLGKHPAMRSGAYVIWFRRIMSADRLSEGWRPYYGEDPHTSHVHVSVALAQVEYDSPAAWGSLTSGGGNVGGSQEGAPPAGTGDGGWTASEGHTAHQNGGAGGVQNAGLSGVPDPGDIKNMAMLGVALFAGVALIAAGAARIAKPAADRAKADGAQAATLLIPEARAATAAGATKGATP